MSAPLRAGLPPMVVALFDDAALFPPGNATMAGAVRRHKQDRELAYAASLGPFVCPDARVAELDQTLGAARIDRFDVALTVPGGPRTLADALGAAYATRRVRVVSVEVPLGSAPVPSVRKALAGGDPALVGYVEVPAAQVHPDLAAQLLAEGLRLKLRTGGTSAAAFPTEDELAGALACGAGQGLAVKCTAGLHHAVRHRDPATGFEQHGFLNIMLAVHAVLTTGGAAAARAALAEQDGAAVAAAIRALDGSQIAAVRGVFRSFGTCSIDEPLADLAALDLLDGTKRDQLDGTKCETDWTGPSETNWTGPSARPTGRDQVRPTERGRVTHHLPYGSLLDSAGRRFAAARLGDQAIDLTALTAAGPFAGLFADGSLDAFLAAGRPVWSAVREMLISGVGDRRQVLRPLAESVPVLPFTVADYVDFYASEQHAGNVGRIFRPDGAALTPNWKHLPIGYHGRAGTVVVSGTDVIRPCGQARAADGGIRFGASQRLDIEAEVGFVVGTGTRLGARVPVSAFRDHVFGLCLLNDWSARDIQAWEYVPLGPFLGKSFATSVSAWITPLDALDGAWTAPPPRDPPVLPYLADAATPAALDLELEISLNGTVISRPPFAGMYWTPAQMLAHLTVNGASLRTGDLFASGTVSGPEPGQRGSLLELSWNGAEPVKLDDGSTRGFLEDGDEVIMRASARTSHGPIELGEVRGRVLPAQPDR